MTENVNTIYTKLTFFPQQGLLLTEKPSHSHFSIVLPPYGEIADFPYYGRPGESGGSDGDTGGTVNVGVGLVRGPVGDTDGSVKVGVGFSGGSVGDSGGIVKVGVGLVNGPVGDTGGSVNTGVGFSGDSVGDTDGSVKVGVESGLGAGLPVGVSVSDIAGVGVAVGRGVGVPGVSFFFNCRNSAIPRASAAPRAFSFSGELIKL